MKRKVPESLKFKDYLIAAVELEAHEPKRIFFLYSMSYLCLKIHVQ